MKASACMSSESGSVRWSVIVPAVGSVTMPFDRSQRFGRSTQAGTPTIRW